MISVAAVSTAPAAKGSAKEDARLFGKLVKLWAEHDRECNERNLEVRLATGRLLNDRLGEPTQRQRRGRSVLKQAAETLQIAESELNRMRWYAYFSKDEQSCWGETPPGRRSWTKFKKILPDLIAALKGAARKGAARKGNEEGRPSSGDRKSEAVPEDGVLRLISSTTSKLRKRNFTVHGTKTDELIGRLRELVDAVSDLTGIRFYVETEQEVTGGHGLNKALAQSRSPLALSHCPMDTATV